MKIIEVPNSKIAAYLKVNITLYPFIFYVGNPAPDVRTHELTHVDQIQKIGVLKFYVSYLLFYFANRLSGLDVNKSYMQIPYEVEAYRNERFYDRNRD